jgi:tetratricopeptide (TPR) repeat protein
MENLARIPEASVTQQDLKLLRDQVDLLQIAAEGQRKPWYRQWAVLTSIIAALFSAVTFAVAQHNQDQQEIRAKKEELRSVLVNLIGLQEDFQTKVMPIPDPVQRANASSFINTKNVIFLEEAERLAEQLDKQVSASEYNVLAIAKQNQSDFERAEQYFVRAVAAARDPITKATALRNLGTFYFQSSPRRDVRRARKNLEDAVNTTENASDDYSKYVTGLSYEQWAFSEKMNGFHAEATRALDLAAQRYGTMSASNSLRKWAEESLAARRAQIH